MAIMAGSVPTDVASKWGIGRQVLPAALLVGINQGLMAVQLMLAGHLAATDVAGVRPLARVHLEVHGELNPCQTDQTPP